MKRTPLARKPIRHRSTFTTPVPNEPCYVDEEADEIFSEYLEKARREIEGPKPTWQCESCGKFYSERTAKDHAACLREEDRRRAEGAWG